MAASTHETSVAALLLQFEKAVRTAKLYPAANPHARDFLAPLHRLFTELLEEIDPLVLRIGRFDLRHEDAIVYASADARESLAYVLYKDGLRELGFHRGLEAGEVQELVQGFNRDFTLEYLEDDVATYLWERDLPHVFFHLSEDYLNDSLPEECRQDADPGATARRVLGVEPFVPARLREKILLRAPGTEFSTVLLRQPQLRPPQLTLSGDELVVLRQLQARDDQHVFFEEMLEVVFSILVQEASEERLRSSLALFRTLFETFLTAGSLSQALHLLRRLRELADQPHPVAPRIRVFLTDLGGGDLLAMLGQSLERGALRDTEALPELLALFPAQAIPGFIQLLGTLNSMKWRRTVCQALARIGSQELPRLVEALQDRRWYVVRNLAYTLGLIGDRRVIPHLGGLVAHEDSRVRKEALRSLSRIDAPEARRRLLDALRHPEATTRLQVLRVLPKTHDAELASALLTFTEEAGFAGLRLEERTELCRALGRLAGDQIVPALETRLGRRGWFGARRRREEQHLAAITLVSLGSEAAHAALARSLPAVGLETRRLIEAALAGSPGGGRPRRRSP